MALTRRPADWGRKKEERKKERERERQREKVVKEGGMNEVVEEENE